MQHPAQVASDGSITNDIMKQNLSRQILAQMQLLMEAEQKAHEQDQQVAMQIPQEASALFSDCKKDTERAHGKINGAM